MTESREAIWITGVGAISALGRGAARLNDALMACESGVRWQAGQPEVGLGPLVAADVREPLGQGLLPAQRALCDRHSLMALEAAAEAWQQAGLPAQAQAPERAACLWGTGLGGSCSLQQSYEQLLMSESHRVHPLTVMRVMGNSAASLLGIQYALQGAQLCFSNACASSAQAIGEAMSLMRQGRADLALVGGSEAMLNSGSLAAWRAMGVMASPDPQDPARSCRPFDDARSGLVLGEGAAALVLETESHARARGAIPLAELLGYGHSVDAVHMSRPDASGQFRAMRAALADAALPACAVDYVNAHGTATEVGDAVEAQSLTELFGVRGVAVSATKALHGHLIGAAGALELVVCVEAAQMRRAPPSAHIRYSALEKDLDLIRHGPRGLPDGAVLMSNSFAFGGSNVSLVLRAV
jgi:3-oxoacyl-(acyl-carrier-protein) synthase